MTLARAVAELGEVAARVDPAGIDRLAAALAGAGRIMVHGCGREGLMMRALAMRLAHLGLAASVQGDMAAPPLGAGDVFLAACGPGRLPTVAALAQVARAAGAQVWMLTAEPEGETIRLADHVLVIPAQTMARADTGILPMGSLFEGALFLLGEMLVLRLMQLTGQGAADLARRHTNME